MYYCYYYYYYYYYYYNYSVSVCHIFNVTVSYGSCSLNIQHARNKYVSRDGVSAQSSKEQ
jgi:hypothetical protein